jgi:hypothetical protein
LRSAPAEAFTGRQTGDPVRNGGAMSAHESVLQPLQPDVDRARGARARVRAVLIEALR